MDDSRFLSSDGDAPSKQKILAEALRLFVRDGLCETSIRAIAAASGYTNPALYKFFESKDALALHLFERCYLLVYDRLAQTSAGSEFEPRLRGLVDGWGVLAQQHLDALLFTNENLRMFWPKLPAATRRKSLLKLFGELIDAGKRTGDVPGRVDTQLAVALITGTLSQVARQLSFGELTRRPQPLASELQRLLYAALTGKEA